MTYSHSLPYYQRVFDILAPHYGVANVISFGMADVIRRQAVVKSDIKKNAVVVDLMCGAGNNVKHLSSVEGLRYLGVDASGHMITCAQRKFVSAGPVRFIQANVLKMTEHLEKADHILCSFGLKCLSPSDYPDFVDAVCRVSGKNCSFSFVEFQLPENSLLKIVVKYYLRSVYRALCYLLLGDTTPANALIRNLENPVQLSQLIELFSERGIELEVEKKMCGAVIALTGKKLGGPL